MLESIKILCLMGPTASGKTDLAIQLVERYPFEIISVDSAYVYRGMDIGTAKPTLAERQRAPHRLIDICDPVDNYSVGQFLEDVNREIQDIVAEQKIPLLVGGTMLYFYVLQNGLANLPTADSVIRLQIEAEAEKYSWAVLHQKLIEIDPALIKHIHANDKQRIQRALELFYLTGQKPSLLQEKTKKNNQYKFFNVIIEPPSRVILHERIALRFDKMLSQGFIAEVEALKARADLNLSLPSMRCVGYRQVWEYLDGCYDYATMREKGKAATRQFAKRQCTWLRRWPEALRLTSGSEDLITIWEQYCQQWNIL